MAADGRRGGVPRVYAWDVIGDLHGVLGRIADIITWVIWGAFVIDYVVSLILAKPRRHWFLHHLLDLAIVVLPVFRPLRLLRWCAWSPSCSGPSGRPSAGGW